MMPLLIPAIMAIAGSAINYQAQQQAASRQREATNRALAVQRERQMQAEKIAREATTQFKTDDRVEKQDAIAQEVEQNLIEPVSASQEVRAAASGTKGDTSSEYGSAKAMSDARTLQSARDLAKMMAKATSANRLRVEEGRNLLTAGMDMDRISSFARGDRSVDDLRIQEAGQVNGLQTLLGSGLQGAGMAGITAGLAAPKVAGVAGGGGISLGSKVGLSGGSGASSIYSLLGR